jgi:hypothetical protein
MGALELISRGGKRFFKKYFSNLKILYRLENLGLIHAGSRNPLKSIFS